MPQDDYVNDPATDQAVPGTEDDVPNNMGVELPVEEPLYVEDEAGGWAAGRTASAEEPERDIAKRDQNELWAKQRPLIQEDVDDGIKLRGIDESRAADVMEALGEDAAEALPDYPEGTSATGSTNTPDHGGFPERD